MEEVNKSKLFGADVSDRKTALSTRSGAGILFAGVGAFRDRMDEYAKQV